LKLALIGTHGVGKTTLAYETCSLLKKSGANVELVTEVARQSPFPVNEATTLEGQLWILHAQIAAELEAARRAPQVICDRAVLDNYCYLVNKFGRCWSASRPSPEKSPTTVFAPRIAPFSSGFMTCCRSYSPTNRSSACAAAWRGSRRASGRRGASESSRWPGR